MDAGIVGPKAADRWLRDGLVVAAVVLLLAGAALAVAAASSELTLAREYPAPRPCGAGLNCTTTAPLQDQPAYQAASAMLDQGVALDVLGAFVGLAAWVTTVNLREEEAANLPPSPPMP